MTDPFRRDFLSQGEFEELSRLVREEAGIHLPPAKKSLLETRMAKRVRALGYDSLAAYRAYLLSPEGRAAEIQPLLDVVTTNKTEFFREPDHFVYLNDRFLPEYLRTKGANIRVWSAGCSTGEEPYSIAMLLSGFFNPGNFSVLATDLSTKVLDEGRLGVYEEEKVAAVPLSMRGSYIMRSRDRSRGVVRVVPEIRAAVEFRRFNLFRDSYPLEEFDLIFCRNVIIYFDKATQHAILTKLAGALKKDGILFLGHSESIAGTALPLAPVAPTAYRKRC